MPINREDKIIFLHIPKTGGTTIEKMFQMTSLDNLCSYYWNTEQFDFIEKNRPLSQSAKLHYEPQHYTIDIIKDLVADYNSCFKFTFVRNPYSRLLSEYFWSTRKTINNYSEFNPGEFHTWCTAFLSVIDLSHKEPQSLYFDHTVDFLGKYEQFERDLHRLTARLAEFSMDLDKYRDVPVPHLNATNLNKELLIHQLLPETKKFIYSVYQSDFRMFLYDSLL